jgi:RimJ/RimL family protein N-acetyltransferase
MRARIVGLTEVRPSSGTSVMAQQTMRAAEVLSTPRLELKPFGAAHFDAFYATCVCDSAVMGFYHAYRSPEPEAQRRARAKRDFVDHFAQGALEYGYICWALTAGPSLPTPQGTFLGWCGILAPALDHSLWGPELAYMLARPWQGMGLATEASKAVLADAWTRYRLPRLHAVVDEPNLPSRRVLERLGLQLNGPVEVYGSAEMMLYTAVVPRST